MIPFGEAQKASRSTDLLYSVCVKRCIWERNVLVERGLFLNEKDTCHFQKSKKVKGM